MLCWNVSICSGKPPKIIYELQEYPGHFRVAYLGSKATARFLNFLDGFWTFRHLN
jgi:hypothetical protein